MSGLGSLISGFFQTVSSVANTASTIKTGVDMVKGANELYENHQKDLDNKYKQANPIKSVFVDRPKKWYE